MSSRVLVTGGAGFIGRRLSRALINKGNEVHIVGRRGSPDLDDVQYWQGDIADAAFARSVWERAKPEIVFHLASHVTGDRRIEQILPTFHANLQSTVNVLLCSAEAGCEKVVLAGSMEEPRSEEPDQVPGSPYAVAKAAGSMYARTFNALYGTPVVTLRTFMVYGPGQRDWSKLIPYVARSLLLEQAPEISSGRRLIDWIYVDDVVEAFMIASTVPDVTGETLDVGSGDQISIREVVETLSALIPSTAKPVFGAIEDRRFDREPIADAERTFLKMGWRATTPLREGLSEVVTWVREELELGAQ
jgi:nucleoside-diphosphate-sugar epimerase